MPMYLSSVNSAIVTVRIGKEMMIRMLAHREAHVNTGIFIIGIDGVRMRRMVAKKFTPVKVVPTPDICSAHIQ